MKLISELKWFYQNNKLKKIKLLVLDVDGVLTNGKLIYGNEGEIFKVFNVKDGLGIKLLQHSGIKLAFLSGGSNGATNYRANDLAIESCFTGIKDKSKAIVDLQKIHKVNKTETAYIGDDLNDIVVLKYVSLLITPKDGSKQIIRKAQLTLNSKGGDGAIREFSERLLKSKNKWANYCKYGWKDSN